MVSNSEPATRIFTKETYSKEEFEAENALFRRYGNDWFFFPAEDAMKMIKEEVAKRKRI